MCPFSCNCMCVSVCIRVAAARTNGWKLYSFFLLFSSSLRSGLFSIHLPLRMTLCVWVWVSFNWLASRYSPSLFIFYFFTLHRSYKLSLSLLFFSLFSLSLVIVALSSLFYCTWSTLQQREWRECVCVCASIDWVVCAVLACELTFSFLPRLMYLLLTGHPSQVEEEWCGSIWWNTLQLLSLLLLLVTFHDDRPGRLFPADKLRENTFIHSASPEEWLLVTSTGQVCTDTFC